MPAQNQLSFITPPQAVDEEQLRALVADLYGPIGSWTVLPGESDLNVRVGFADRVGMLKISAEDGTGFAGFQTQLIAHLARHEPELPVPKVIPTFSGVDDVIIDKGFDTPVHARMTTFLPGTPARELVLDDSLMRAIGATLARIHVALATFDVPLPERHTNWDIRSVGDYLRAAAFSDAAVTPEHQQWTDILEEFTEVHLPSLDQWAAQLIHNDLNGSNVLIDPDENKVTAVFDLGDVNFAPRIVDIGVAAAYLADATTPRAMSASVAAFVSGYRDVTPLDEEEAAFIPYVMKTRYALALTLNSARAEFARDDPAYVAYVTRNSDGSRRRLATVLAQR